MVRGTLGRRWFGWCLAVIVMRRKVVCLAILRHAGQRAAARVRAIVLAGCRKVSRHLGVVESVCEAVRVAKGSGVSGADVPT